MLQMSEIPTHHAGKMTAYLLHNSEKFFPPLNGACTLANLIMTITAYLKRNESPAAAAKLPWVGASLVLNLATTAWALGIMVPMNKAMARLSEEKLTASSADEKSEKEFRGLQARWRKLNYGESQFRSRYTVGRNDWLTFDSLQVVLRSCSLLLSLLCTACLRMALSSRFKCCFAEKSFIIDIQYIHYHNWKQGLVTKYSCTFLWDFWIYGFRLAMLDDEVDLRCEPGSRQPPRCILFFQNIKERSAHRCLCSLSHCN